MPALGKKPQVLGWQKFGTQQPSEAQVSSWTTKRPRARNTGVVCGLLRPIDLDVDDATLSWECHEAVKSVLGLNLPCRVGKWPRVALFARSDDPNRKKLRYEFHKGAVDVLGAGAQVIVAGTHPDTGKSYYWVEEPPWEMSIDRLPVLTAGQEGKIIAEVSHILGGSLAPIPNPSPSVGHVRVARGQRNNALWREILHEAQSCSTETELLEWSKVLNAKRCLEPMSLSDLQAMVKWAWTQKLEGRIWRGEARAAMTASECAKLGPDAFYLLAKLRLAHGAAPGKVFSVSPIAIAPTLPMGPKRVWQALRELVGQGRLEHVAPARPMVAAKYRLR